MDLKGISQNIKNIWDEKLPEPAQNYKLKHATLVLVAIFVLYQFYSYVVWKVKNQEIKQMAQIVVDRRNSKIYDFDLTGLNVDYILSLDIKGLQHELRKGTFTSVDLVKVFSDRCQRIGRSLNLTTEENFSEALDLAKQRDLERQIAIEEGEEAVEGLSQMHGIPFSVKDQINQKQKLSTLGLAHLCTDRAKDDAVVVKLFQNAGAIPIVRGNVPQAGLSYHTANLVFGTARNPLRETRTCGGSSGGDAGLVAARCVPCSLGVDWGGSICIPAAFCGVYGMKPTTNRISHQGKSAALKTRFQSSRHLDSTCGPIGASVDDLIVTMETLCDPNVNALDPLCIPHPWNQAELEKVHDPDNIKKIKIGIIYESEFMPVSRAVRRAIKKTETALINLGYQVVPFAFSKSKWTQMREIFMGLFGSEYGWDIVEGMVAECETLLPPSKGSGILLKAGMIKRFLIDFTLKYILCHRRKYTHLNGMRSRSPKQMELFLKQRYDFVYQMSQQWREAGITAVISPVFPTCAFKTESADELGGITEYCIFQSVTGFPSGVMPVTRVHSDEQSYADMYRDKWTETMERDSQKSYNMPIAIQVTGFAFQDEAVLGIMKALEAEIQYEVPMPPVISSDFKEMTEQLRKKAKPPKMDYSQIPKFDDLK